MKTPQVPALQDMTPLGFNMVDNFTQYMLDFYGPSGVYDYGFTSEQINLATQLYKTRLAENYPGQVFEGDSVDRERVRDIIVQTCYPELV
jgi:hypothetical protein